MPHEGWEFFILDPTDENKYPHEKTQIIYNKMYTAAYNKLLQDLCIPEPNDFLQSDKDCTFLYYIKCGGEDDIIKLAEEYDYNFLKSVFLDKRGAAIKKYLHLYYNSHNIYVKNMYKDGSDYYIELEKKKLSM